MDLRTLTEDVYPYQVLTESITHRKTLLQYQSKTVQHDVCLGFKVGE